MEEFHLDIFPGDFGLPSLDRECLLTLAYCRFSGIPVKVHHRTNLYFSKVPALKVQKDIIYGAANIIDYFERKNFSSDIEGSNSKLDLWSYKTLITKKLEPCLQFFWWYDLDNYVEFLSGWYAKRLPFPTNFFIPNSMRKDAVAKLEAQFSNKVIEHDSKGTLIENSVTNEARYCLNLMIEKLADQNFFFGDKPTSFDAFVFSYLALLYKVPTKKPVIQNHINVSEPLKNYIDRVLKVYFAKDSFHTSKSPFDKDNDSDTFSTIKWRDVVFSGAFAGLLMVFYAVSNGILSIKDSEDSDDFQEDESNLPEEGQHEHEH